MKKFLSNLNELQRMLLLALCVALGLALLALIPLFVFNQPGWLIGIGIGSLIEIFNIFLLYKASDVALQNFQASMFLIFYFLRMTLFLVGFVVTALFSYGITNVVEPISAFYNSLWGVLIAYTPLQVVIVIIMNKSKKSIVSISENNKVNESEDEKK